MSIDSAPASNTGRSSCRQTACVTVVPEMAAKIRDLFQADAATREQPHEAVPEVSRRPVLRIQISPRQDRPERSSDIRSIETAADQAGKHEVAVLPGATRTLPLSTLGNPVALSASTQRFGNASVLRDFLVLVSPPAPTDRQTRTDGGRGGTVDGSPSRSTRSQVRALSSSVRAPTRMDNTTYA
jgi:hypothetical protein